MPDHIFFKPNEGAEAFKIRLRSAIECAPDRAFGTGGRFHLHPHHQILFEREPLLEDDPETWDLLAIRWVEPKIHTTFNQKKFTFSDLCLKSMRTQTGESHYEFKNYKWRAADPQIADLDLGALRLIWQSSTGPRTYTADCLYVTADGCIFADEVKASRSYFIEPNYKARMKRVERDLASVGITLNRVVASHVEELRLRRHNLERAFLDRLTAFSAQEVEAVTGLFERRHGSAALEEVEEVLNVDRLLSRQIIHAMLCRRKLAYALDQSITRHIEVTAAPLAGKVPDIRAIDFRIAGPSAFDC